MSETSKGCNVYNKPGAAAHHIQQHFPPVYLCTYNIVSLLWASHSCYTTIHLLTCFAFLSLGSALCWVLLFFAFTLSLTPPPPPPPPPPPLFLFVSPTFSSAVCFCLSNSFSLCHFLFVSVLLLFSSLFFSRIMCLEFVPNHKRL